MMKPLLITLATFLLLVTGCNQESILSPNLSEDESSISSEAVSKTDMSQSDVYRTPGPPSGPIVGQSSLTRNKQGVSVNLVTSVVPAGHAVTIWGVIFPDATLCAVRFPRFGVGQVKPHV